MIQTRSTSISAWRASWKVLFLLLLLLLLPFLLLFLFPLLFPSLSLPYFLSLSLALGARAMTFDKDDVIIHEGNRDQRLYQIGECVPVHIVEV